MPTVRKRPLTDLDVNSSPSPKRRTQQHIRLQDVSGPSVASSSPTLVGSVTQPSTPQSIDATDSEQTDSAASSATSDSEDTDIEDSETVTESSSSNESSEVSTLTTHTHHYPLALLRPPQSEIDSASTSGTDTSQGSVTSTSESKTTKIPPSLSSSASSDSQESSSPSVSAESSSQSDSEESSCPSDSEDSSSNSPSETSTPASPNAIANAYAGSLQLTTQNLRDLEGRLDRLLPKMESANKKLEELCTAGRLGERNIEHLEDDDGGEKGYIEMNLGLGVLEEKRGEDSDSDSDDDDESDSSGSSGDEEESKTAHETFVHGAHADPIARLFRGSEEKGRAKVKIEEVEGS